MDSPDPGVQADSDAGPPTRRHTDPDPSLTAEHLRRLWEAGGRNITVTYDEEVVRHRAYLARPRTDI